MEAFHRKNNAKKQSSKKYMTLKSKIFLAMRIALVVGTILGIINHYDMFLSGNYETSRIVKILITYLVPFSVSLYSTTRIKHN